MQLDAVLRYPSYWKVSKMSGLNLFHGKLSSLHIVLFPGMQRMTYCFSLQHDGIVTFPFIGLCISRASWAASVCLAFPQRSHFWGRSCWSLLCALSPVFVYFIQWLLNIKCGHARSYFWCLQLLQVVETSKRARISPQLPGPFCPLWNACGKKFAHKLCLQQLMWGKGTYANVLWQLNKTDSERMLYRENTYGNVLRKNKHI